MDVPDGDARAPEEGAPRFRLGYRPGLEGLRGVAILLVVVFHAGTFLAPEGSRHHFFGMFIGVDVFFTLSGFLITSLLLQEHRSTGRISFSGFYMRRALRLLPAVVALLVVCVGYVVATDQSMRTYAKTAFGVLTYTTNWLFLNDVAFTDGFGHMWSLAIEEQFYLLWPALLYLLIRATRHRTEALLVVVLGVVVLGAIWRALLWERYEAWPDVYFRTDARLDQLLLGAALAIALHLGLLRTKARPWLAVVALAGIGAIAMTTDHASAPYFQWAAALTAVASATAIYSTLEDGGIVHAALSSTPMRYLGRISYSLYLWHLPVDIFFRREFRDMPIAAKLVLSQLIGLALAVASHYVVERPFLQLKDRLHRRAVGEPSAETAPLTA
jgi:peptidoglycan/LPS O-acetylase OafA/YrhL